ncbi:MAG: hypothetical protein HYY18_11595 [Planctomycetes bacterium]|nr:hypothetical protein [Planctomycetota bacterium]
MLVVLAAGCATPPPPTAWTEEDLTACQRLADYSEMADAVWKRWSEVRISCIHREGVDESGLVDRLALFGLEVKLDAEAVDDDFHAGIHDLPGDQYLLLHLSAKDWACLVTESGDVAVFPPERRPQYETAAIRDADELAEARNDVAGEHLEEEDGRNSAALASVTVTLELESSSLYDLVDRLQETFRLNFTIAKDVRAAGIPDDPLRVSWRDRNLGAALEEVLAPLELAAWVESRVIVIGFRSRLHARDAGAAARARRRLETNKLLASPVGLSGDLSLRDACAALAAALGKRPRISPELWRESSRIVLEARERPASEIFAEIDRCRPSAVVLRGDVLWFVERR